MNYKYNLYMEGKIVGHLSLENNTILLNGDSKFENDSDFKNLYSLIQDNTIKKGQFNVKKDGLNIYNAPEDLWIALKQELIKNGVLFEPQETNQS